MKSGRLLDRLTPQKLSCSPFKSWAKIGNLSRNSHLCNWPNCTTSTAWWTIICAVLRSALLIRENRAIPTLQTSLSRCWIQRLFSKIPPKRPWLILVRPSGKRKRKWLTRRQTIELFDRKSSNFCLNSRKSIDCKKGTNFNTSWRKRKSCAKCSTGIAMCTRSKS